MIDTQKCTRLERGGITKDTGYATRARTAQGSASTAEDPVEVVEDEIVCQAGSG